jgi:hypothetical protein
MFRSLHVATSPLLEFVQISLRELDDEDGYEDEEEINDDEDSADEDDANVGLCEILTGGAASLQTVRLQNIGLHSCMPPLSVVTDLHIHGVPSGPSLPYATMCTVFSNFPALTHLVLHGHFVRDSNLAKSSTSTITFPALSSFHLLSSGKSFACLPILAIVSAPLLERLFLEEIFDDIGALLQSPGWRTASPRYPCLRSLTLTLSEPLEPTTWRYIAQSFATVTDLAVLIAWSTAFPDSEAFVYAIGITSNRQLSTEVSWPSLQMLSCGEIRSNQVEPLCLAMSARAAMGRPLRKFRLLTEQSSIHYISKDELAQFRLYTEVEKYEPRRWPGGNMDDWYNGD